MVPGDVPGDGQYSTAKLMASLLYSHYNVQTPFFLHGDTVKQKKKKKTCLLPVVEYFSHLG